MSPDFAIPLYMNMYKLHHVKITSADENYIFKFLLLYLFFSWTKCYLGQEGALRQITSLVSLPLERSPSFSPWPHALSGLVRSFPSHSPRTHRAPCCCRGPSRVPEPRVSQGRLKQGSQLVDLQQTMLSHWTSVPFPHKLETQCLPHKAAAIKLNKKKNAMTLVIQSILIISCSQLMTQDQLMSMDSF